MFFAHSLEGQDRDAWQPLAEHLEAVSRLTSLRAEKFGAARLGAIVGLLHDLGKYAQAFQDYIAGIGPSRDHATAGAQEIQQLAAPSGADRIAALIGAYCIAGHHGGLPNWSRDRALSERLKKQLPELNPVWRDELAPVAHGLFSTNFKWDGAADRAAFQLAMLGRMLFSCLVDADYRDTERFYAEAEGGSVDCDWPVLAAIIESLIARFDLYMAGMATRGGDALLALLRADILAHARGSLGGPDGLAMDEQDNLAIAHAGLGTVWIFDRLGEPLYRVRSCQGLATTNLAYGGPDNKNLYITESETGCVLVARIPVAGRVMASHQPSC
ncbi:CRISPR-associated endonuclease Cas3'' [Bradyrhizobium sp.]|uniref:CRISPR-associated endonuclease Cas3'' n=1 Tax=Bradyrhizobium sp. TaxID=376 RepID=UPI00239DC220|nr:CRISPR-associated endonuclease Cas3'' [Bradyrhizobium sp.]MDE2378934.1 CRISPR-associated endonuclease Cas3'' [Bradyrhizobium sp.]